ncbi:hypothetical protein J2W32_001176 [Variovorax boronicumulans]|uniref:Phage coat protein n=1 Tax=Variovorax boronicumulans TaxID=436515 RepID=A0AAW8CUU4_9BURK|nr:hypothetical protein [Variovorax boronicumulans]MDP9892380.1 hypothetical protein [Variovorax boronicumulans]MDQ0052140.1 hypothetical protein [Variovorax boronicumulans]
MFKNAYTFARKHGAKLAASVVAGTASVGAFAQTSTNPIVQLLNEVSLEGVAAAVLALCVIIVAIALTMKGPDVSKRVIRKV